LETFAAKGVETAWAGSWFPGDNYQPTLCKISAVQCLNITEVSAPTADAPQYVQFTGSQLSLNASPMFVASYLLSSLHRALIFIRPPPTPQLRPLQMKTDLHCSTKPRTNINSRCFPPHSATSSLACSSHHNRTNELATSDRFTSVSPPVFSLFQHYIKNVIRA
jgi:hypothetical protein